MMIRLSPEQISIGWNILRGQLIRSLPTSLGVDASATSNILYSLLDEEAQLWVYYEDIEKGIPLAITMTAIIDEPISHARYLLIYAFSSVGELSTAHYEDGLETLRKFSVSRGCEQILAYVEDERFVHKLQAIGGQKITNLVRL